MISLRYIHGIQLPFRSFSQLNPKTPQLSYLRAENVNFAEFFGMKEYFFGSTYGFSHYFVVFLADKSESRITIASLLMCQNLHKISVIFSPFSHKHLVFQFYFAVESSQLFCSMVSYNCSQILYVYAKTILLTDQKCYPT